MSNYFKIYNQDLNNPELKNLSLLQLTLISYLRSFQTIGKYYYGGQSLLCKLFRTSPKNLFNQLKELEDLGIIIITNDQKYLKSFGNRKAIVLIKHLDEPIDCEFHEEPVQEITKPTKVEKTIIEKPIIMKEEKPIENKSNPVAPTIIPPPMVLEDNFSKEVTLTTLYGIFKVEDDLVDYYISLLDKPGAMKKLKTSPSSNILNHRIREKKENEIIINIPGLN